MNKKQKDYIKKSVCMRYLFTWIFITTILALFLTEFFIVKNIFGTLLLILFYLIVTISLSVLFARYEIKELIKG